MKILSLITHFKHIQSWELATTRIDKIYPNWQMMNLFIKAWNVAKIAPQYDCIVFFYDPFLLVLFTVCHFLANCSRKKPIIVFTTLLYDVSTFNNKRVGVRGFYNYLKLNLYRFFINRCDKIVVHSSNEIKLYSGFFKVPEEKFSFVPYFVRRDALLESQKKDENHEPIYIIVAGRHRDFATFINAIENSNYQGIIVCGQSDKEDLPSSLPSNISVFYEIPFQQYRDLISQSRTLVIPFPKNKMLRSLGQVAAFEAVAKRVPIIASKSFQLTDYFESEKEILYFESENPQNLRHQIDRLSMDDDLRRDLVENAHRKMMNKFTDQVYSDSILEICDRLRINKLDIEIND